MQFLKQVLSVFQGMAANTGNPYRSVWWEQCSRLFLKYMEDHHSLLAVSCQPVCHGQVDGCGSTNLRLRAFPHLFFFFFFQASTLIVGEQDPHENFHNSSDDVCCQLALLCLSPAPSNSMHSTQIKFGQAPSCFESKPLFVPCLQQHTDSQFPTLV